jgi:hypothetical protein
MLLRSNRDVPLHSLIVRGTLFLENTSITKANRLCLHAPSIEMITGFAKQ